ncbi:hypothetical protein [Pseudonocardia charpentierae]|uniref:MarR family transcriptional regulator n=1 Tax=Pseudonocardia charpentierae TaxID=3075545 RepID=A0ABU2NIE7_9PSEU|nr:hypothetical protein [Pseudonocardia sp. DSM 45834]MDT0353745.1 hypothetical protein [Pseudonocardia sp. DSM 45834]
MDDPSRSNTPASTPDPQREWHALLSGFGAMTDALGADPEETRGALIRFGVSPHLVHAVYVAYRAGERWPR